MKRILSIIFTVCIALNVFAVSSFATNSESFKANAYFRYEDSSTYLVIEGTTSALYSQKIVAMVYDPLFTEDSGIETIKDEYGFLVDDIAAARPVESMAQVLRFADTLSKDGEFSMEIPVEGIENGQYMIITVGGGGSNSESVSILAYYETENHINAVTLPAFENATADTVGALLAEKQYLLGIDLGEAYQSNKDEVNSLFISVRDEDISADVTTGKKINSADDIKEIFNLAISLASLPDTPSEAEILSFVAKYKTLIGYDFSSENADFVLAESEYGAISENILKEAEVNSFADLEKVITQAVGIVMLNSKDSTTIAPVVDKYALILGVDTADYEIYCNKYTAYEVNKAFVAKNFKTPEDVVEALKKRITVLADASGSGGGGTGGSGGSGGSGGFGGTGGLSSSNNSLLDMLVQTVPEYIDDAVAFSDVSEKHWANEAIVALCEKNILNGFEDGTFRPDSAVTREQFVKMIVTAFDLYYDNGMTRFDDVSEDRWSYTYILTAASGGIINGVTETEFMPENKITRQDAAVMLDRLCEKVGITLNGEAASTDEDEIAGYAKESVAKLKAANIISGFEDGSFRPSEGLTRAQAAKLIYGLISR